MIWKIIIIFFLIENNFKFTESLSHFLSETQSQRMVLELPEETEEIEKKLKEICLKFSGNNSYKELEQATEEFKNCKRTNQEAIWDYIRDGIWKRGINYYTDLYEQIDEAKGLCNRTLEILKCQKNYNKVFEKCLDDKKRKKLIQVEGYLKHILDYICYNNTERPIKFYTNKGSECNIVNYSNINEQCGRFPPADMNALFNRTSLLDLLEIDQVIQCKLAQKFWDCYVGNMKNCPNKTPANMFKDFSDHMLKYYECYKLLNND